MNNIVASLDIGSSKICAIIAEVNKGQFSVLGVGTSESKGVKKGIIVDIDSTADAIKSAIKQAENMSNKEIKSVFTNIYGGYCVLYKNRGVIAVSGENKEISNDDLRRVIEAAKVVIIPPDKEIVDIIPEQFIVDGSEGVRDPRGMSGVRLEVDANIVTVPCTTAQNIIKTINKAGYQVDGIVLQPISESNIVLNKDEKNLGVALIDVGAEITDIAIFKGGKLIYNKLIPVGGYNLTNDISLISKISLNDAEKIKRQYGAASSKFIKNIDTIKINDISGKGEKEISLLDIAKIMDDRIYELLYLIKKTLNESGYCNDLSAGIVITGGGLFNIKGMVDVSQEVLDMPVRFGYPNYIGVANPIYSSSAGISLYMLKQKRTSNVLNAKNVICDNVSKEEEKQNSFDLVHKIKEFFTDFF